MRKRIVALGIGVFAAMLLSYNPAMAAPKKARVRHVAASTAKVDNATLARNVQARFARTRSLKELTIHVQANQGVVTLSGTVPKWWQKGLATREARVVSGVKKVDNQLKIAPGGMPPPRKHAKKAANAG